MHSNELGGDSEAAPLNRHFRLQPFFWRAKIMPDQHLNNPLLRLDALLLLLFFLIMVNPLVGCTAVQRVNDHQRSLLEIECSPSDASVFVDDTYLGEVDRWRGGVIPLRPGKYRVEVQHDDYIPFQLDLTLKSGRMTTLKLDLIAQTAKIEAIEPEAPTSQRHQRHLWNGSTRLPTTP